MHEVFTARKAFGLCAIIVAILASSVRADAEIERVNVVYAEPDGAPLEMTLFLPPEGSEVEGTLRPAVVMMHGGGWFLRLQRKLVWFSERLAENGYLAAIIDYRLMPRHHFPAPLHDAKAAVRWLRINADEYAIDPDRIAALGMSAGGHLAALLATTPHPDEFEGAENRGASSAVQAAVALYAPLDLTIFEDPDSGGLLRWISNQYITRFVEEVEDMKEGLSGAETASPITYVDSETSPILLIHGGRDRLVPIEHSWSFFKKLEQREAPARIIPYPDHRHGFARFPTSTRDEIFEEILRFLDESLPS